MTWFLLRALSHTKVAAVKSTLSLIRWSKFVRQVHFFKELRELTEP